MLRIRTYRDVALYSVLITLVALVAVATFVHVATVHRVPPPAYRFAMLLATGLPIVIAAPISALALSMARFITIGLDKIEAFVKFDALTGVLARSYFMETVRQRFGEGGAFMLIDADHFKKVNDTYGHDVGDEALRTVGGVLNLSSPAAAIVGRLGGEEFGMFLPGISDARARDVAERICAAIRTEGETIAGKPVHLTLSIGIAMIEPRSTLTLIVKEADECLYSAKEAGRDRYVLGHDVPLPPVMFRSAG